MAIARRQLRPHRIDAQVRSHAKRLADQWRAAGFDVDIVEYLQTSSEAGGYTLTAQGPSAVLSCRCQSWAVGMWPWLRRPLWTIAVSVRTGDNVRLQEVGTSAGWDHQAAWDRVQKWIDGEDALPASLEDALAALP